MNRAAHLSEKLNNVLVEGTPVKFHFKDGKKAAAFQKALLDINYVAYAGTSGEGALIGVHTGTDDQKILKMGASAGGELIN